MRSVSLVPVDCFSVIRRPADGKESLRLGPLLESALQRIDQPVALLDDPVLGLEHLLALAALSTHERPDLS